MAQNGNVSDVRVPPRLRGTRKDRMKFRSGLLLGATFAAGLALTPVSDVLLHRYGGDLWITHARAAEESGSGTYQLLSLFGDVFERVKADYVEPVKDKSLVEN